MSDYESSISSHLMIHNELREVGATMSYYLICTDEIQMEGSKASDEPH